MKQVARPTWDGDRIAAETFVHDPAPWIAVRA
jgi:hypothetical protein